MAGKAAANLTLGTQSRKPNKFGRDKTLPRTLPTVCKEVKLHPSIISVRL
jgi:hypothetical protein